MLKRIIPFLLSLVLLVILLYFSDFFKVLNLLKTADYSFIFLGFLFWFLGLMVRSLRWNYLLKKVGINISLIDTIHVYIPSLFVSNVTPAKSGDVVRPFFLKTMKKRSFTKSLASVFIERFSDVVILISFSLLSFITLSTNLSFYLFLSIGLYSLLFGSIFFIVVSEKRTKKVVNFLFKLFLSRIKIFKKFGSKIVRFSSLLSRSIKTYKKPKTILTTLFFSFLVWMIEAFILKIGFGTVGVNVSYLSCIFALSISALISVITFLPGGLGVSETVIMILFGQLYNLSPSEVMAGMIFSRFYSYWTYIVLGSLIAGLSKYKLSEIE